MKKHRLPTAAAVIALTIAILTGCGGTEQGQQTDETVIYQTAEATAPLLYEESTVAEDMPDIGREQVMAIVLERVPGATEGDVYELESEYDDGRLEYEVSLLR